MLNLKQRLQAGDTLIEVLFAVSVFSLVVVGALTIMNQGTAASQRALEITLVRQQIDAQAETLRFMHDSYVAVYQPGITFNLTDNQTSPAEEWYKMRQFITTAGLTADTYQNGSCPTTPLPGSFVVDPRNVAAITSQASIQPALGTSAQVTYNSSGAFTSANGLWIRAVASPTSSDPTQSNTGYIDFYIRACWDSFGLPLPSNQAKIVRLYEPRG
jgi:type II secretory pathway pseudopilin PulG